MKRGDERETMCVVVVYEEKEDTFLIHYATEQSMRAPSLVIHFATTVAAATMTREHQQPLPEQNSHVAGKWVCVSFTHVRDRVYTQLAWY